MIQPAAAAENYVPTKEDFVFLSQRDIRTDANFASQSYWRGVFTHFFKNRRAVVGLVIILLIVIFAIFGPVMNSFGYRDIVQYRNEKNKRVVAKGISPQIPALHQLLTGEALEGNFAEYTFLFGTDDLGRDLWTRTWYGARVSLLIAFVTIIIDMIIGMSYGLISGYFGGMVDNVMQRFVEIANSVPRLVIVSVLAIFMPKGMGLVIVALLLTEWIGMSKIARAEMLKIKEQEYVLASRTLGARNKHIIFKEILPNTIGPIITQVMFSIPTAIFTEAFLSFVGVGIVLPQCSVGTLIEDGFNNITTLPYQILPPIIVLALLMLGFNFIGDGLREALAPKLEDM
ncbi:MAG: ABC transporter permease [Clostridia bacterium]|nr:ABC transporter permease [Clostridia bacterium]MBR0219714.1 ABC transporter permease [Clostridia bacterium]